MAVVAQRSEKVRRYIEDSGLPLDILIDDSRETVKAYVVLKPGETATEKEIIDFCRLKLAAYTRKIHLLANNHPADY